jgi:glucuronate isomerase
MLAMNFIHENFLLRSKTAQNLYHTYAANEPIFDYHSHLPPADIATNRQFKDLFEISLEGDHYKWRVMRANGIDERFCTGNADPYDKFAAWARTVPVTLRNPLYHWTHLELVRYFGIRELLDESSAKWIWDRGNTMLQTPELSAQGILKKFAVRVSCTTDDPCDDLAHHKSVNAAKLGFRMYPTFRPDKALRVDQPELFNAWVSRLERAANAAISNFTKFLDALKRRHDYFHSVGARLSDHGINHCYANPCTEAEAEKIFSKVRGGTPATFEEHEQFSSLLMLFFGKLDAMRGWTKQLHLGALRSVNTRMLRELGPDTGYDNIGDWNQAEPLSRYLNLLEQENALPKMVLYNVNPIDNYVLATVAGSFQDGKIAGKVQFGSGWWFLDQKEGMEWQINALSNTGLLSRFIGMLTDSRSFMSFPRHEYFRRVLCNLIGQDVENGELPHDEKLLGTTIRNICFANAAQFLALEQPASSELATPANG